MTDKGIRHPGMSAEYIRAANPFRSSELAHMPELLAAAWDEGHHAGHEDARAVQPTYPDPTPNPYRPTEGA